VEQPRILRVHQLAVGAKEDLSRGGLECLFLLKEPEEADSCHDHLPSRGPKVWGDQGHVLFPHLGLDHMYVHLDESVLDAHVAFHICHTRPEASNPGLDTAVESLWEVAVAQNLVADVLVAEHFHDGHCACQQCQVGSEDLQLMASVVEEARAFVADSQVSRPGWRGLTGVRKPLCHVELVESMSH
jgi:hypothetical protein